MRDVTLAEAYELAPIPSGYISREQFQFRRSERRNGAEWSLSRTRLDAAVATVYDDGRLEDWLQTYAQEPGLGRLRFITASAEEKTAGLLTWARSEWNDTLWLVDIRVHTDARRAGIGSTLCRALVAHGKALSARGIHVETQVRNVPAIQFYRTFGFEFSGFNEHLYSNSGREEQDVAVYLFLPIQPS